MPLIFRHNEPKPGHCIYYKYGRRVKSMYSRLIIDGNAVYEIDEECLKQRQGRKGYGGKNRGRKVLFRPERQVRPANKPGFPARKNRE